MFLNVFCYSISDEEEHERPVIHRTPSQLQRLVAAKAGRLMDVNDGKGKGKRKVMPLREIFGAKSSFRQDLLPRAPTPVPEVYTNVTVYIG